MQAAELAKVRIGIVARLAIVCSALLLISAGFVQAQKAPKKAGVSIVPNEAARRVDIFVDGQPFTSYIYPESLKKPVLYPLRTAVGTPITRGYPFDPRPGERVDHPHHVGLWFNYGDVNGVDFWNNSTALTPEEQKKMGTIYHRAIKNVKDGKDQGELTVMTEWVMPDGKTILREDTQYVFHAPSANMRIVDRITTLTAQDGRVVFKDNKEGVLGLRVARELEQPSTKPEIFTDASGRPTAVPSLNNEGVSGMYRSSAGKTGDDVWATRGSWTTLSGKIKSEPITLAIFDHPRNPGYPTYWHARGYGLFAANPLGQKVFAEAKGDKATGELNFTLEPKKFVTFRHRLVIASGEMTPEQIEQQQQRFAAQAK